MLSHHFFRDIILLSLAVSILASCSGNLADTGAAIRPRKENSTNIIQVQNLQNERCRYVIEGVRYRVQNSNRFPIKEFQNIHVESGSNFVFELKEDRFYFVEYLVIGHLIRKGIRIPFDFVWDSSSKVLAIPANAVCQNKKP